MGKQKQLFFTMGIKSVILSSNLFSILEQSMDFKNIKRLIQLVEESQISAFMIEEDDVKIEIKKESPSSVVSVIPQSVATAVPPSVPAAPTHDVSADSVAEPVSDSPVRDKGLVPILSPMVGTFYMSPNPESPSFVNVGDTIQSGDVVCIVEAMKLFNEIESEISGTVEKILVDNANPVEFGQELMLVRVN